MYPILNSLFSQFDKKIYALLSEEGGKNIDYFAGEWFDVLDFREEANYDTYWKEEDSPDDILTEKDILALEKGRLLREYNNKFPGGKITIQSDPWEDNLSVFVEPSWSHNLIRDTNKTAKFAQEVFLKEYTGLETLLQVAKDRSIPDWIKGLGFPEGRVEVIEYIGKRKDKAALETFKDIILNDESMACRYEAIKGVFRINPNKEFFAELIDTLPTLRFYQHRQYANGVLAMAVVANVKNLDNEFAYLLEEEMKVAIEKNDEFNNPYGDLLMERTVMEDTLIAFIEYNKIAALEFIREHYNSPYDLVRNVIDHTLTKVLYTQEMANKNVLETFGTWKTIEDCTREYKNLEESKGILHISNKIISLDAEQVDYFDTRWKNAHLRWQSATKSSIHTPSKEEFKKYGNINSNQKEYSQSENLPF